jgi:inner membrane transporter RhtA
MAFWRPWRRAWTWADVPILVLFGATLGLMNLLFYNAIKTVPFGLAIAVEFTGPLAVALWSSKKPLDFVWIVLAVAGMGLILPLGNASGADMQAAAIDPVGIAYALGAGACWAVYIVVGNAWPIALGHLPHPWGCWWQLCWSPLSASVAGSFIVEPRVDVGWLRHCLAVECYSVQLGNVFTQTPAQTNLQHLAQSRARRRCIGGLAGSFRTT